MNASEFILGMSERPAVAAVVEIPGLLARARSGDEAAFEQLMTLHERQVLLTSLRLLGRLEDAQDAAQEVFLRLYRNLKIFGSVAEMRPWLYRVTVNVCRDLIRKYGRVAASDEIEMAVEAGVEIEIGQEQERALLAEALMRLPEKERAAIVLREIEGLETAEVAEILGSSPETVRAQVSTGKQKLRAIVQRLMRRKS